MGVFADFSDAFDNLYSQYEIAHGRVLITGLGFGILLKALDAKQEVESITVIEKEQDIIDAFLKNNRVSDKVKIIKDDATTYAPEEEYDCLLPDHYEKQTWEWKVNDMNAISKRIKHKHFWPWSIELLFFKKVYPKNEHTKDIALMLSENPSEVYKKWQDFIKDYFEGNEYLLSIEQEKIVQYLYLYKKHYPYR
jgi:16S rRNA A1518/A1519 N6-dimethyltransferase RsmA/KsgA/DIM1 with predicted DNA glycosylase/AP lyase activity